MQPMLSAPEPHGHLMHGHKVKTWLASGAVNGPLSTNQPSITLPFQRWFKFKEAFSPQLVLDILGRQTAGTIRRCIDPFGGCGTTGLTCQFVGVHPVLVEVNPFIADLADAKLSTYDLDNLTKDFVGVRAKARRRERVDFGLLSEAPSTLCEPGNGERWVFPRVVLERLLQYRLAIEGVSDEINRRLLRVLLGSVVVGVSNVTVNGKGRKYRGSWESQQSSSRDVDEAFHAAFLNAVGDITQFGKRATSSFELRRGTCLEQIEGVEPCDLALFSPPYPNSFDYTDIYNLELWVLGYLRSREDNRNLRSATLRSHVQTAGQYSYAMAPSAMLRGVVDELAAAQSQLWDSRLPAMIGAYFEDMQRLLTSLRAVLRPGGRAFIVIGESSYAGIRVRAGHISAQIAREIGFRVAHHTRLRTMRRSAQQGGEHELEERLVELVAV